MLSQPRRPRSKAARWVARSPQLGAGGSGINALANLCNLANDGNPPVGSVNPQDLIAQALANAQAAAQAQTLWSQGSGSFSLTTPGGGLSTGAKIGIGAAVIGVVGLGAWFLLKK